MYCTYTTLPPRCPNGALINKANSTVIVTLQHMGLATVSRQHTHYKNYTTVQLYAEETRYMASW